VVLEGLKPCYPTRAVAPRERERSREAPVQPGGWQLFSTECVHYALSRAQVPVPNVWWHLKCERGPQPYSGRGADESAGYGGNGRGGEGVGGPAAGRRAPGAAPVAPRGGRCAPVAGGGGAPHRRRDERRRGARRRRGVRRGPARGGDRGREPARGHLPGRQRGRHAAHCARGEASQGPALRLRVVAPSSRARRRCGRRTRRGG
jgi:hypothetical protein